MENPNRFRTAALGVLLATFGFMCGYLINERPPGPPPPPPRYAEQAPPPHCGMDRRAVAMGWSTEQPYTTVIVMQDGQPVRIEQSGGPIALAESGPPPAPPVQGENHNGLLLAVLMLSLMPILTWAALAWNRRKGQTDPFVESEPVYQEFVPRRDD